MNKKLVVNVVALVLLMLGALGSGYGQSESLLPAITNSSLATTDSPSKETNWEAKDPSARKWAWR